MSQLKTLSYPKLQNMSETCLILIQYQFPCLFDFICAPNSISGLVLYNGLNSIKFLQLFSFIWVKIYGYLYLFPLSNYFLQTPQNYSDFTWSFLLSNLSSYLVFHYWNICSEICFNYFFYYFMYLWLVITL